MVSLEKSLLKNKPNGLAAVLEKEAPIKTSDNYYVLQEAIKDGTIKNHGYRGIFKQLEKHVVSGSFFYPRIDRGKSGQMDGLMTLKFLEFSVKFSGAFLNFDFQKLVSMNDSSRLYKGVYHKALQDSVGNFDTYCLVSKAKTNHSLAQATLD